MIKGKTKIELFDAKTGQRQYVHESSNMVTNAISQLTNVMAAANQRLDDCVFPISQNALGGIMLFDGDVEENVNNVFFPTNVHLTGYAGRVDGKGTLRGTYNTIESKETENSFTSVWDFDTSQANGNIKSVCLTSALSGQSPLSYFHRYVPDNMYNGQVNTYGRWYFVRYDGEYAIMYKLNNNVATFIKTRIPLLKHKINDGLTHIPLKYETLLEVSTNTDPVSGNYANGYQYYYDNGDGYIYVIMNRANDSGDGIFSYFTINYGDGSYNTSAPRRVVVPDAKFGGYDYNGVVNNGMYYVPSKDMKGVYRINLKNTNDVSYTRVVREDKDGGANDRIDEWRPIRIPGGGVIFSTSYYQITSSYENRGTILYEDGTVITEDYNTPQNGGTNYSYNCNCYPYGIVALQGRDDSYSQQYCYPCYYSSYLGTINNLPSMITKKSTQTMKITYTLTDAE